MTQIGAGLWPAGGLAFNRNRPIGWCTATPDSIRPALRRAVDEGITHFDVADVYGLGQAERALGEALAGLRRADFQIGSKVGYFRGTASHAYHPRQMKTQLMNSLDNLGTDYLDIYSFHNIDFGPGDIFLDDALDLMNRWRKEGRIRAVGLRALHRHTADSDHPTAQMAQARFAAISERVAPDVVQLKFNLLVDPGPARDIAAWAEREGVGIVVNKPFAQGLALDKYAGSAGPAFPPGDHRSAKSSFTRPAFEMIGARLRRMLRALGAERADLPRIAAGYALSLSAGAGAVFGFTSEEQLAGIAALDGTGLADQEVRVIEEIMHGIAAELASLPSVWAP